MEKFDLCIIGAGPSGYAAAMRSVDFGKKTLLIEKDKVGGAGLYNGALSSKTMWELSEKLRTVNEGIKSVGGKVIDMSWEETQKTLMDATFDRKFQYSCHLKLLQSKALNNIFKYERGLGTFIDNHHVKIQKLNEENKTIYAENIIIATGSKPRTIPNIDVDEKIIMTENIVLKNQMSMINGNKLILDINSGKIEIFDDKLDQERVKGVLVDQSNKEEQ